MHPFKQHFLPHPENDHHAPALHRKRHVLFGSLAVMMKGLIIVVSVLLPLEVFVTPDALNGQIQDILEETNELRAGAGEALLMHDTRLEASAAYKAADMRDQQYFSHVSPQGVRVGTLVRRAGYDYQYAGENLAIGYGTAASVLEAWRESPTHYRNLVHPVFTDIGVGVAVGEQQGRPVPYFVQHFGVERGDEKAVLGTFTDASETIVLPQSRIFWQEVAGGIEINPQVYLSKPAERVVITHFANDIALAPESAMYTTTTFLLTDEETLFNPTLPVSITIETADGEIIESIVPWQDPSVLTPTIAQRYEMAVKYVDEMLPLIIVSRLFLVLAIGVVLLSLLAHMAWSVHERKHGIAFEAVWAIALFILLLLI